MPLFVDEVVVSVEVDNSASGGASSASPIADDKQALIAECVERVLEILAQREER
ncbi:DUF5908 family protein [Sorangium sp. So ce385]|uniref:DUF5908 family protein n=1 Tax=Sorangium sp. So ce385 TaxID=3133308 RepID=UPI003F5CB72E